MKIAIRRVAGRALSVLSVAGGLLLALSSPVRAVGGSVSDGDATFEIDSYGSTPVAHLTGVSSNLATEHLFHSGWWYRFADDTREYPFPDPDTEAWGESAFTNQAFLEWEDLGGREGVYVLETVQVFALSVAFPEPSGYVLRTLQVHNFTGQPLEIDVFHYADFDLDGPAGDAATLREVTPTLLIRVDDSGGTVGSVGTGYALDIAREDVTYAVAIRTAGLLSLLNDTLTNEFGNTGLPIAAGDFTAVLQYRLEIPPNEIRGPSISMLVNALAPCNYYNGLFCDGFELGSTSIWSSKQP